MTMSLSQLIQTFQSGTLSREAFYAEIDHVLAVDVANCARLREAVDETQTVRPLPDAVYAEVLRRIEHRQDNTADPDDSTRIHETLVAARAAATGDDAEHLKGIGDTLNGRFVLEEC